MGRCHIAQNRLYNTFKAYSMIKLDFQKYLKHGCIVKEKDAKIGREY